MELSKKLLQESSPHKRFGTDLEPRRWWILTAFSLYNCSVAVAWLTYGAISGPSMQYFDININQLLLFSDSFLYMYFLFSYIGCYLVYKMFKKFLLLCAFLTALGGWVRYFAGPHFYGALSGQIITGLAYAPAFGFATLLPDRWFSMKERFLVTTIAVYSSYAGWAIGYILPCVIVGDDIANMDTSLLVQAIIMTAPIVLSVLCVEEKPKVPPSYSALVKLNDKMSFMEEMKILLNMKNFVANSVIFGLVLGVSYSISTISAIFMEPLNLSYLEQGIIGFSYVVSGLIAGFVGTVWIDKHGLNNYDSMIKILLSLSLASLTVLGIIFIFIEHPGMFIIWGCNCILGVGLIGFTPFICSSIIESTFPVQESMSTNAMFMMTQILSVITGHLCTSEFVGRGGFLLLAVLILPCWAYAVFFYKTEYKKQKADDGHQEINQELQEFINYTTEDVAGPSGFIQ